MLDVLLLFFGGFRFEYFRAPSEEEFDFGLKELWNRRVEEGLGGPRYGDT